MLAYRTSHDHNFENTLSVISLFMWFSETQNANNFKTILLAKMNSGQKYR